MTVLNNLIISITITHLTLSLQIPPEFTDSFNGLQVDAKPDDHGEYQVEEYTIYSRDMDPTKCSFHRLGEDVCFRCSLDSPIKITAENKEDHLEIDSLIDVPAETIYTINIDSSNWGKTDRNFIPDNGASSISEVLEIYMEPYDTFLTNMAGMQVKIESTFEEFGFYVILEFPYAVDNSRIRDRMMII